MIVNKLIFILFLVISTNVFSQSSNDSIIVLLENGVTSVLSNSDKSQLAISYSGNNTISRNKLNFNTNSNYLLVYSNSITSNELVLFNEINVYTMIIKELSLEQKDVLKSLEMIYRDFGLNPATFYKDNPSLYDRMLEVFAKDGIPPQKKQITSMLKDFCHKFQASGIVNKKNQNIH